MRNSARLSNRNIPLVEAAHYGGRQRPTAVLLRTSWTTGDSGAANGIAQTWHNPNSRLDSCHYVVDNKTVIRCVPDRVEAFATKESHKGAISINVCHDPPYGPELTAVQLAAELTARLCRLYHIPVRILDETGEANWGRYRWRRRGGILLRIVGSFPTKQFFTHVENAYEDF